MPICHAEHLELPDFVNHLRLLSSTSFVIRYLIDLFLFLGVSQTQARPKESTSDTYLAHVH